MTGAGRFVRTGDVRYAKLRPFLESAVTWFRKPFALLFVVRARPCHAPVHATTIW